MLIMERTVTHFEHVCLSEGSPFQPGVINIFVNETQFTVETRRKTNETKTRKPLRHTCVHSGGNDVDDYDVLYLPAVCLSPLAVV